MELFAGIPVSDYSAARSWYERLLGAEPAFEPHDTECVWELTEQGFVYINEDPERAGRAVMTILVPDLDAAVEAIASRGIEPAKEETYSNGVRKTTFRDADGNEIGYSGGAPDEG